MAQGQAKASDKKEVLEVRVVDNVELMQSGTELSVAFKKLVFDPEGKFIETKRLPARIIKLGSSKSSSF